MLIFELSSLSLVAQIEPLALGGSFVIGLATMLLSWWIFRALWSDDLEQDADWRYDVSRVNELRRRDVVYRLFHPMVQLIARLNQAAFKTKLPEVYREIQAAGLSRCWLPEEFLARGQVIAILLAPIYLWLMIFWFGSTGIMLGVALTIATAVYTRVRLSRIARHRLVMIKRRMPFFLDLMTLLMESGSSFLQSLQESVDEFSGYPISTEFGRVLTDMNMGKARTEAFDNLRERLNDEEINSIVGSIIRSEELGTPLTNIFRSQADVLLVKRTQRAETIAGEAGVNMLLPGVLVMASTVIIILGPFLLGYYQLGDL